MADPAIPIRRESVRAAIRRDLALTHPEFKDQDAERAGGYRAIEAHIDKLIDIVRRTSAQRVEPYLAEFLDDICTTCPHQDASGHCGVRSLGRCALFRDAGPLVEAVARVLDNTEDPQYRANHPGRPTESAATILPVRWVVPC